MTLLITEVAKLLNCPIPDIRYYLMQRKHRETVNQHFKNVLLQTTYKNRNGCKKTFQFGGITVNGANKVLAYGRLRMPFNCSIAAHFYARHRIRLVYPFLNCVIDTNFPGESHFYPMELLEIIGWDGSPNRLIITDSDTDKCNIILRVCPHCKDLCEVHCPCIYETGSDEKLKGMGDGMFAQVW